MKTFCWFIEFFACCHTGPELNRTMEPFDLVRIISLHCEAKSSRATNPWPLVGCSSDRTQCDCYEHWNTATWLVRLSQPWVLIGEKSQVAASRLKMWQLENEGARSGVGRNSSELSAAQCSSVEISSTSQSESVSWHSPGDLVCIISDRKYIGTHLVTQHMLHVWWGYQNWC